MSDNNIIIYSKKECPYCIKAKDLLKTLNLEYNEIILDPSNENYKETVDELKQKYNQDVQQLTDKSGFPAETSAILLSTLCHVNG